MTDPTAPLPDEELAAIEAFYIDRTSNRLPASLAPTRSIPRLLAALRAERAARARVEAEYEAYRDEHNGWCARVFAPATSEGAE